MKKLLLVVSCAFLLGGYGVCSASGATFDWTLTGVDAGSGTITATPTATSGVYQITGITGTLSSSTFNPTSEPILGLIPPGAWPFPNSTIDPITHLPDESNYDLLYYPASIATGAPSYQTSPAYLDIHGVSFYAGVMGDCSLNVPTTGCFNLYYGNNQGQPQNYPQDTGYNILYPDTVANFLLSDFTITPSTSSAITPEPASLVLLGTAAMGMFGAIRRRIKQA